MTIQPRQPHGHLPVNQSPVRSARRSHSPNLPINKGGHVSRHSASSPQNSPVSGSPANTGWQQPPGSTTVLSSSPGPIRSAPRYRRSLQGWLLETFPVNYRETMNGLRLPLHRIHITGSCSLTIILTYVQVSMQGRV